MSTISRDFKALPIANPFKLHPEDGCMKAETCSCYVLSINYITYNQVGSDYKFTYM